MFRVLFGLLMAFNTLRFGYFGWIEDHFINPGFHFTYFGFGWVEPLPGPVMYALHVLAFLAALGIMLGWYYRLAAFLFFLLFTYFELIDLTYYLNHYYFISLMSALIIFMPLNRNFSLDVFFNRVAQSDVVPRWPLVLIRGQLALVYVYAGLAKMNPDWLLNALPLRIWLPANSDMPVLGPLFNLEITAYVFSWAGMLFDTFIVFFLLFSKTRPWAYAVVVFFHAVTGWLFQIGVFPLVMSVLVLIFFSQEFHAGIIRFIRQLLPKFPAKPMEVSKKIPGLLKPLSFGILIGYAAFQLLFPWRFVFYPGNFLWTEEAYRFGWRVMLAEKAGTARFFVKDGESGREGEVDNREFLNAHQEKQMSFQPDMILQFAKHLEGVFKERGMKDPHVRCEAWVTLNGRPGKLLFDPYLELTGLEDTFATKTWIEPLEDE
jgi:hypothetical protein